jgi:intracellular multiplication protein IcmL
MAYNALETVKLRNEFYRDNYRKVASALLVAMFAIVVLACAIVYLVTHRPAPKYFATTESGRIIPLIALDQPNFNSKAIRSWAANMATSSYSYNFVNYRKAFSDNQKYFTTDGWDDFLKSLQASGNLDAVKNRKLIVSAVPTGTPVIQDQGVFKGRYYWRVQVPLLVTYQGGSGSFHNNILATITIERVSTLDHSDGIGVAAFTGTSQDS